MSGQPGNDSYDGLLRATRLAIARAKRRGAEEVTPDDLFSGLLQSIAHFGIVLVGDLILDLEALDEELLSEVDAAGPKVAYTKAAASLFDRAAAVARRERAPQIEPIHMLAAFAREEDGLMGRLKSTYGVTAGEWRAALAKRSRYEVRDGAAVHRPIGAQELLSPDEAADFLGVHTQTVRGYIRSGKLPAHRLAGERVIRILRQDLLDLLEPYDEE